MVTSVNAWEITAIQLHFQFLLLSEHSRANHSEVSSCRLSWGCSKEVHSVMHFTPCVMFTVFLSLNALAHRNTFFLCHPFWKCSCGGMAGSAKWNMKLWDLPPYWIGLWCCLLSFPYWQEKILELIHDTESQTVDSSIHKESKGRY